MRSASNMIPAATANAIIQIAIFFVGLIETGLTTVKT